MVKRNFAHIIAVEGFEESAELEKKTFHTHFATGPLALSFSFSVLVILIVHSSGNGVHLTDQSINIGIGIQRSRYKI